MPVYEVEVTRTGSVTDTVTVRATSEAEARSIAIDNAGDWDYEFDDTQVDSLRELNADEAITAEEVLT